MARPEWRGSLSEPHLPASSAASWLPGRRDGERVSAKSARAHLDLGERLWIKASWCVAV